MINLKCIICSTPLHSLTWLAKLVLVLAQISHHSFLSFWGICLEFCKNYTPKNFGQGPDPPPPPPLGSDIVQSFANFFQKTVPYTKVGPMSGTF